MMPSENQIVNIVATDHGRNTPSTIHLGIPNNIVDASTVVGGSQYEAPNIQIAKMHQATTIHRDSRTALSLTGFIKLAGLS